MADFVRGPVLLRGGACTPAHSVPSEHVITGGVSGLARELFGPEDWEYMAGITDEDMAREVDFFEQVNSTTPAHLKLPPAD